MKTTIKDNMMCLVNCEKIRKQTASKPYNRMQNMQKFTLLHFTQRCWKGGCGSAAGALSCSVVAAGCDRDLIVLDEIGNRIFVMPMLFLVALFRLLMMLSMLLRGNWQLFC